MAGPLGRGGRWHEFLSWYNIVVVYEPGKDNDVADGMSRWAYPAGWRMTPTSMVRTRTSRGMRTRKRRKRPEMMPSLISCPYLAKELSLDPRAAIQPSATVTAAGTAICARPVTTPAFIMSVSAWKRPLRTSWMPRGQLMLCSFQNTGPR